MDWPLAAVILGFLAPVTAAVIRLVPNRNGVKRAEQIPGLSKVCRMHEAEMSALREAISLASQANAHTAEAIDAINSRLERIEAKLYS